MAREANAVGGIVVCSLLWDPHPKAFHFSRCYDETWVTKLRNGFKRNLNVPHQFVLFTDRPRDLDPDIIQVFISRRPIDYGSCIEPYRLNTPMILVGLDTIITGNIDHLADYCLLSDNIALIQDPYDENAVGNGVALVPEGQRHVYDRWNGENDMTWMRQQKYKVLDRLFPGHIVSYKGTVKHSGLKDARIVYFHGNEKPHELPDVPWIQEHWK